MNPIFHTFSSTGPTSAISGLPLVQTALFLVLLYAPSSPSFSQLLFCHPHWPSVLMYSLFVHSLFHGLYIIFLLFSFPFSSFSCPCTSFFSFFYFFFFFLPLVLPRFLFLPFLKLLSVRNSGFRKAVLLSLLCLPLKYRPMQTCPWRMGW